MISPAQCRAARAVLKLSQEDVSNLSRVSVSTIRDFEGGKRKMIKNNNLAIQIAFEMQNVVFNNNSISWSVKSRVDNYVLRRIAAAQRKYESTHGPADTKWEDLTLEYRTLLIQEEPA